MLSLGKLKGKPKCLRKVAVLGKYPQNFRRHRGTKGSGSGNAEAAVGPEATVIQRRITCSAPATQQPPVIMSNNLQKYLEGKIVCT